MDINRLQNFYHGPNVNNPCYVVNITAEHGIWQSDNPLTQALPLLIYQLTVRMVIFQFVYFLLKPFHIPRIASDILSGLLVGFAGQSYHYMKLINPLRALLTKETIAYYFLCLHLFLLGLSTDISAVFRVGKKATIFALSSLFIPFCIGTGLYFLTADAMDHKTGCFFWGASIAVTGFPVVARVLTDLRIIHSELGRMAMSTSLVNDVASWVLLSILLPAQVSFLSTLMSVFLTVGFTAFCFYCVRPCLAFLISMSCKDKVYTESYLSFVLATVSLFALSSDALGTSPMVGAFVYGLVMPSRELAAKLLETYDECVTDIFLPIFFATCGEMARMGSVNNWFVGILVVLLACGAKLVGGLVAAFVFDTSKKDGFAVGAAMNGKGILAMVMLMMGVSGKLMTQEAFTLAVMTMFLTTAVMPLILRHFHSPGRRLSNYKGRTIKQSGNDGEFRILTCFQEPRNVSGMINLLDSSNGTKESPLVVSAINLIETTGRNTSMLIVHSSGKISSAHMKRSPHIEQIITSLQTYSTLNEGLVNILPMTLLSPYANMHEDICSLAEDKQVSFIILPFHKQPTQNEPLEEESEEGVNFRGVNLNVLANAPCTVGIFVDKGFGATGDGESNLKTRRVALIFIGGPDDREALAYTWRLAGSQGLTVTIIRFIGGNNLEEYEPIDLPVGDAHRMLTSISYVDRQKRTDNRCIDEFRLKFTGVETVTYVEKYVNNEGEMLSVLKETDNVFDLYIVGKGEGIISPLTVGLMDWCEFPELGALGDLLVTSSFAEHGSVLVIQQYAGAGDLANLLASSSSDEASTRNGRDRFSSWHRRQSSEEGDDEGSEMELFAKQNKKISNDDNGLMMGSPS